MAQATLGDVLGYLRRVCAAQAYRDLPDNQLLEKFLTSQEDIAFAALVKRHGPMVQGVCQRTLGDFHDAEDAFQATFLVLARRAGSIRKRDAVGNWLYGVAQRIAIKARAKTTARRNRERQLRDMPTTEPLDDLTWQELRAVLDEEIARLPAKCRAAIVLCYFEGRTHEQAAKELGLPRRTLTNRLERGREQLRHALDTPGHRPIGGGIATVFGEKVTAAPVGAMLVINTVKAAMSVAAGKAVAAGCASATAVGLAEEAVMGMILGKVKVVLLVAALGFGVCGAGLAGYGGWAAKRNQDPTEEVQPLASKAAPRRKERRNAQAPVDLYGDPLPEGALARFGVCSFRHEGGATRLAYTLDGRTLIAQTYSGVVLWDAATGKELRRVPVRMSNYGVGMDVSADGTTLAIANGPEDDETRIDLWDLRSGKKTRSIALPNGEGQAEVIREVCFSPDGSSIALTAHNSGKAMVFDLVSGQIRASLGGKDNRFYNIAFSPDSKSLATVEEPNHGVRIWDTKTWKLIRTVYKPPERAPGDPGDFVSAISFSADGKLLALGSTRIVLIDPNTSDELGQITASVGASVGPIMCMALSPNGKTVVANGRPGRDRKIIVWEIPTGKILHILDGRSEGRSVAFSPDGKSIAVGAGSRTIQVYDAATGKERFADFQGHYSSINSVAFTSDRRTLISTEFTGKVYRWNLASKERNGLIDGDANSLSFSAGNEKLAMIAGKGDKMATKVRVWDFASNKEALLIPVPGTQIVESAVFFGDGQKLATLDWNDKRQNLYAVRHWDAATGVQDKIWPVPNQNYREGLYIASLGADGKTVFAALNDSTISVYDTLSARKRLFRGQENEGGVSLSPDARLLASWKNAPNSAVRLWEVESGKEILLLNAHQDQVAFAAWSPDGRVLACGEKRGDRNQATFDQSVRLWDVAKGKELTRYSGFKADVTALNFARNGTLLAAGLADGTILVWDVDKVLPKAILQNVSDEQLRSFWKDLSADNAATAHQAMWTMIASPNQSVPFLSTQLKPVAPEDAGKVQQWIADLDSDKFAVRQVAAKELEKVGDQVKPPIQKALKGDLSLEAHRRLEAVLNALADVPDPETLRAIRAIMVLERIGSPEAQVCIGNVGWRRAGARETEEAKAALARLGKRPAGTH